MESDVPPTYQSHPLRRLKMYLHIYDSVRYAVPRSGFHQFVFPGVDCGEHFAFLRVPQTPQKVTIPDRWKYGASKRFDTGTQKFDPFYLEVHDARKGQQDV
jgi:hypothetical protein